VALAAGGWVVAARRRARLARTSVASSSVPPMTAPRRRALTVLGLDQQQGAGDDAWLGTALGEVLRAELAAGGTLRVTSADDVARLRSDLELIEGQATHPSPGELARLDTSLATDLVLTGSYLLTDGSGGRTIRLQLALLDATGHQVGRFEDAAPEADLHGLASRAGLALRQQVGAGAGVAPQHALLLLPPGDAARPYVEGLTHLRAFDPTTALARLQAAAKLAPDHPLVQAALAEAWSALGQPREAETAARRAFELSAPLEQEQRLLIEARLRSLTHDLGRTVDLYHALWTLHPDEVDHGVRLVDAQVAAGRPKEAQASLSALRALEPRLAHDPRIDLAAAGAAGARGSFREQREAAAAAARAGLARGQRWLYAQARYLEGKALWRLGELDAALAAYAEARGAFERVGDRHSVALALSSSGVVLRNRGDLTGARPLFEQALALQRSLGNRSDEGVVLSNLASLLDRQGETLPGLRVLRQAIAIADEVGNLSEQVRLQGTLAQRLIDLGELREARARVESVIAISHQLGNRSVAAEALATLGFIQLLEDDLPGARHSLEAALAAHQELGEATSVAFNRLNLATVAAEQGRLEEAVGLFRQAAEEYARDGSAKYEALARAELAQLLVDHDRLVEAAKQAARATAIAGTMRDLNLRDNVDISNARVRAGSGQREDVDSALALLRRAAARAKQAVNYSEWVDTRVVIGKLEARAHRPSARRDLAAARADAERFGLRLYVRKAREAAAGLP
jgi:tetratricopeptide (TPR) repeat protein